MPVAFQRIVSNVLLAIACVTTAGCATEGELTRAARARSDSAIEDLDRRPICCEDLPRLRYQLLAQSRFSVNVPTDAPQVRSFQTGRSYFVAVEVPQGDRPIAVNIRSSLLDGGRGMIPTVFVPSVVKLDGDFKPLADQQELSLCFRRGWSKNDVGYFSTLNVDPSRVRYLIFLTDRSNLAGAVPYESSATTANLGSVASMKVNYQFPRSPNGHLDVWLDSRLDSIRELPESCVH